MRRSWKWIRMRYDKMPMQRKMLLSYSVPMIMLMILIGILLVPKIQQKYEKELSARTMQSLDQAESFLEQHVANFYYIEELLEKHETFHKYITIPDEGLREGDQFRKVLGILQVLQELEASYHSYQLSLYSEGEMEGTGDTYYLRTISDLQQLPDWEELSDALEHSRYYFMSMEDVSRTQENGSVSYLAMFRKMSFLMNNGEVTHIIAKVELRKKDMITLLQNATETAGAITFVTNKEGLLFSSDEVWEEEWKDAGEIFYGRLQVSDWTQIPIDGKNYMVISKGIQRTDWTLYTLIPRNAFLAEARLVALILILVLGFLCLMVFLVSELLAVSIGKRLSVLNDSIQEIRGGDLLTHIRTEDEMEGDEIQAIYHSFNEMTEELQHLVKEHYELGKKVTRTELEALQAQIKPHFLYNTLDLINWGAMDYGADDIARIARDLGQFYRMSLNHGQPVIRIANELKLVTSYVNIENVHYDGMIDLKIEVPEEIRECACLNLVLQLLVENAIVHGIAEHPELTFCSIRIFGRMEDADLILCVEDDGPGIPEEQLSHLLDYEENLTNEKKGGYGVKNINFRHKLIFGENYGVFYESKVGEGTRAYIRIPAMSCEEMVRNYL